MRRSLPKYPRTDISQIPSRFLEDLPTKSTLRIVPQRRYGMTKPGLVISKIINIGRHDLTWLKNNTCNAKANQKITPCTVSTSWIRKGT